MIFVHNSGFKELKSMANLQKVQATCGMITLEVDKVPFLICNPIIVVCEMILWLLNGKRY